MESKNNTFKDFISPILVLVVICFVVTFLLAFTYGITAPIIEANTKASADASRTTLLEAAEGSFDEYTGELYELGDGKSVVTECYTASNGTGIVVTAKTNSYGGDLTAMIGIDSEGAITGVQVTEASDTPGVGTKAQAESHLSQYTGLTELTSDDVKKDTNVEAVTGATVSSKAVHRCVYCAMEQFKLMGGAQ